MTPDQLFSRELSKYSEAENQNAWEELKARLDRQGQFVFRKRPAILIREWGVTGSGYAHLYLDLLFHDAIEGGQICLRYGFRRAVALVGRFALTEGRDREVGQAVLLLCHHAQLKMSRTNQRNARSSRGRNKNKPTDQEINRALESFRRTPSHSQRNEVSYLVKLFRKKGKNVSDSWMRDHIKKLHN